MICLFYSSRSRLRARASDSCLCAGRGGGREGGRRGRGEKRRGDKRRAALHAISMGGKFLTSKRVMVWSLMCGCDS